MTVIITTYFLIALLTISLYNYFSADRMEDLVPSPTGEKPKVSILIPARNEADNLSRLLPMVLRSDYPNLEILVLDDHSDDPTAATVTRLAAGDPRLKLIQGRDLPEKWLGKNWACQQLADSAHGDILIFCDADVKVGPVAVARTVAWMESQKLSCLTALPRQEMVTWTEKAVLPLIMYLPSLSLLPLRKVTTFSSNRFLVANGQWLCFSREAYRAIGGHEAVKDQVLGDMGLGKLIKARKDFHLLPVIATEDLSVRMYRDWEELKSGCSKNLYLLVGATEASLAIFMIVTAFALVLPWLWPLVGKWVWMIPLVFVFLLRVVVRSIFRSDWETVLLHPVGSILLLHLVFNSYQKYQSNDVQWKGRPLAR